MTRIAIAMILAAGALAQAPPPANEPLTPVKGSIAGTVRDAGTGAPIKDADLYVYRNTPREAHAATDSEGRYTLRGVEPGSIRISANGKGPEGATGFGASAAKFISLASGQELTGVDFHLRTLAQISGRVFDENKEPVPGIDVFLVAREYSRGAMRYIYASLGKSDDQGAYVLNRVTPGRAYLVMAAKRTLRLSPISEAPAVLRLRRPAVVPTFYPGQKFAEGAEAVVLGVGERRENMDIRLLRAQSYCIEGVVEGAPSLRFEISPQQPTSGMVGDGGFFVAEPGGTAGPDGKIRICDLAPGDYQLRVNELSPRPGALSFSGTTLVSIVDQDVRNVRAPAVPWLPVPGEIAWDGTPPEPPVEAKPFIQAEPIGRGQYMGETLGVPSSIPGQFSFPGLMLGPYGPRVRGLPPSLYLKDIIYDNRSVLYEPMRVGSAMGNATLRVIVGLDGGTVSVKVVDRDNRPVSDAFVVIAPSHVNSEGLLAAAMVRGQTDQNGAWTCGQLAPGKYFAIASNSAFDLSPESAGKIWRARTLAQEVELAPKGKVSVTIEPKILN